MKSVEELQQIVNEFFFKLNNDRLLVLVDVLEDLKVIAGARGFKLPLSNMPVGQIYVSKQLLNELSDDELKFVLAHEVVHIDQNHLPISVLLRLPKTILNEIGKVRPLAAAASLLWDLIKIWIYSQGFMPPEVTITKQQELQADVWAIFLTGNKTAAISCLKKLVNYNLDQPSHTWEVLDVRLPVMTMRERIKQVLTIINYYEQQGYKFI